MRECDFLIVGAGIGGTSCAHFLSLEHSVILLEMEDRSGYHTTGRSVAIYTEAYGPRTIRALAIAGGEFFRKPPSGFTETALCKQFGLVFIAREDQTSVLYAALETVKDLSANIAEISVERVRELVPVMRPGYMAAAFLDPNTLSLDVDAIYQGYIRGLKSNRAEIVTDAEALGFERKGDKWHVHTKAGEFAAPVVINAAGAWADVVAERAGARRVGLQPKRRTVIAFPVPDGVDASQWPVIFDCEEKFYFKVDAGTILGSPADETPVPPQDIQPDELDIAITVDRLQQATTLKIERIIRKWAGLRSFVDDQVPVVGYAPDLEGFFWCAGQGGYGIETSYGMGRVSAALASGKSMPEDIRALGVTPGDLAPQRLW